MVVQDVGWHTFIALIFLTMQAFLAESSLLVVSEVRFQNRDSTTARASGRLDLLRIDFSKLQFGRRISVTEEDTDDHLIA